MCDGDGDYDYYGDACPRGSPREVRDEGDHPSMDAALAEVLENHTIRQN